MKRSVSQAGLVLVVLLLSTFSFVLPATAQTSWQPLPQPKALTKQQEQFYPDLETWVPAAASPRVLLVGLPPVSWDQAQPLLQQFPAVKKIFAQGRFGQLDSSARFDCAAALWWQIGQPEFGSWDCRSHASTQNVYLSSLLSAFQLQAQAFGPGAEFLLSKTPGASVLKPAASKTALEATTAVDKQSILAQLPKTDQVLQSTQEKNLTVVDLNLPGGAQWEAKPSWSSIDSSQLQQVTWQWLSGLLEKLDNQVRVILFSTNLGVDEPGVVASYSRYQDSGLLVSNRLHLPGFVQSLDLNGEIVGQLSLPMRTKPAPKSLNTFNPISVSGSSKSIVNNLSSPQSIQDFSSRGRYLSQQIKLFENFTGYHYLFWFIPILVAVLALGSFLVLRRRHLKSWLLFFAVWVVGLPLGYLFTTHVLLNRWPGFFAPTPQLLQGNVSMLLALGLVGVLALGYLLLSRVLWRLGSGKVGTVVTGLASILVLLALSMQVLTGPGFPGAPANQPVQPVKESTPLVVVFTEGLQWEDLKNSPAAPELSKQLAKAATFSFIPINQRTAPCPQDVWLTLSAGTRPAQNSVGGSNLCAHTASEKQIKAYSKQNKPLPFWDYYQEMGRDYGLRSPLGTLGGVLHQAGVSQAAIGDGAIWATVNQDGVAQGTAVDWPESTADLRRVVSNTVNNNQVTYIAATGTISQVNQNPDRIITEVKHQKYALRQALEHLDQNTQVNGQSVDKNWTADTAFLIPGRVDAQTLQLLELSDVAQRAAENDQEFPLVDLGTGPEAASQAKQIIDSDLPTHSQIQITKLSSLLTANPKKYHDQLIKWWQKYREFLPDQSIDQPITESQLQRQYQDYLNDQAQKLTEVLNAIPSSARVIVLSASSARHPQTHQLGLLYGPGINGGTVYSSSVKHQGLAQAADLTPTILNWLGLNDQAQKLNLNGSPLSLVAGSAHLDWTNQANRASAALAAGSSYYQLVSKLVITLVVLALVFLNAGLWQNISLVALRIGLFRRRRVRSGQKLSEAPAAALPPATPTQINQIKWTDLGITRFIHDHLQPIVLYFFYLGFLYLTALPLAGFLTSCFNWWQTENPTFTFISRALLIAVALTFWAAWGPWRKIRFAPALFLAGLNVWFYGLDIIAGSRIIQDSPVGFLTLIGGRFYGMGNEGYSLLSTSLLMILSVLGVYIFQRSHRAHSHQRLLRILTNILIIVVGLGFIYLDGAPGLGADFGGPVSFLPGLAILLIMLNQWRISWFKIVLVGLITVGASATLCIADYLRPPSARTHLGRFVQSVLDGQLLNVLWQKGNGNLATLTSSPHRWTVLFALLLGVVLWRILSGGSKLCASIFAWQRPLPAVCAVPAASAGASNNQTSCRIRFNRALLRRIWSAPGRWIDRNYRWLVPLPGQTEHLGTFKPLTILLASVITCQFFAFSLNDSGINLTGLAVQACFFPLVAFALKEREAQIHC